MKTRLIWIGLFVLTMVWQRTARAEELTVIVAISADATIDQIAIDHDISVLAELPELSLFRVEAASGLENDARITAIYPDSTLDARPSYIVATGDILEAAPAAGSVQQVESQPALALLRVAQAHTISRGAGVTVAILDTGVEFEHPLLTDHLVSGYDFVSVDSDAADEADGSDTDGDWMFDEGAGHGSHVAGIIASVAPDATILPVRIFDSNGHGFNFNVAQGIIYAVSQGADVINLSGNTSSGEPFLQDAINYAAQAGVVVVASAGLNNIGYPAGYANTISVAATDINDWRTALSHFSTGDVTSYAPGEQILSAYHGGRYARWTGHSMATPFVTGTAALMMATGNCDADCVQATLMDGARPIDVNELGRRLDVYDAVGSAADQQDITLQTRATNTSDDLPQDNVRKLWLQIDNQAHTLSLDELTLRYWYQNEAVSAEIFHCDWAAVGCANVTGTFGVDRGMQYLEVGFAAGVLFGSADSGQIQLRTHHVDWATYDETNDYSYHAVSDLEMWERVTAYYNGELVWGTEPDTPTAVTVVAQASVGQPSTGTFLIALSLTLLIAATVHYLVGLKLRQQPAGLRATRQQ